MIRKKYNYIILILVFGFVSACSEIIFETDISQSYVNVLAPSQNSNVNSGSISFTWESVEYADNYNIQIATPNFAAAKQIVADSNVVGTNFSWQLLPNNYEWRIRAQNSAFETVYFYNNLMVSEPEDFTDREVILLSPQQDFVSNELAHTLSWESVEGANEYRVQLLKTDENGTIEHEENTSNTSIEFEFVEGEYTWQVRAQNSTQNTLYYSRQLLIDTTEPDQVTLQTPVDNSSEKEGKITFNWQRKDVGGSQEFDSIYIYNDKALSNLIWKEGSDKKQIEKELTKDDYYWYVKPFDKAGNMGLESTVFGLEVN